MDHDRLFKELISNFFGEFVELFLPDVSAYLDKDADFSLFGIIGSGNGGIRGSFGKIRAF